MEACQHQANTEDIISFGDCGRHVWNWRFDVIEVFIVLEGIVSLVCR